jgi:hypothetical protein
VLLFLIPQWDIGSEYPAVTKLNRGLCQYIKHKAPTIRILCVVHKISKQDMEDAKLHSVELYETKSELPEGTVINAVIGYEHVTGRQALNLAAKLKALSMLIVYSESSDAMITEERHTLQDVAEEADILFTVGPKLWFEYQRDPQYRVKNTQLLPNISSIHDQLATNQFSYSKENWSILWVSPPKKSKQDEVITNGIIQTILRIQSSYPQMVMVQVPYTSTNNLRLFSCAALIIAPSVSKSFDLVALESMLCGIPTFVMSTSGLGEFLEKNFHETAKPFIVAISFTASEINDNWMIKIAGGFNSSAWDDARKLQKALQTTDLFKRSHDLFISTTVEKCREPRLNLKTKSSRSYEASIIISSTLSSASTSAAPPSSASTPKHSVLYTSTYSSSLPSHDLLSPFDQNETTDQPLPLFDPVSSAIDLKVCL